MEIAKRNVVLTACILTCMISSMFIVYSNSVNTATATDFMNVKAPVNYGDRFQYEWYSGSGGGNGPAMENFGAGPAPNSVDVAWKQSNMSFAGAFSSRVFGSGTGRTYALDPDTGAILYSWSGTGSLIKLDDTYMLQGSNCRRISNGSIVWTDSAWMSVYGRTQSIAYDQYNKLMWVAGNTMWSFANPAQPPTLVWNQSIVEDGWITYRHYAIIGDGKVFLKHLGIEVRCFNETTGELLWRTPTRGTITYQALYTEGKFIGGSLSGDVVALDGETGEELWTYNPGGYWNFWASWPAAGYGIWFMQNFDGHLYALNATTGKVIWKYKGPGHFYPAGPTVADYKVYCPIGTANYRDPATGARGWDEVVCLDAFTGRVLFTAPLDTGQVYSAFGNLYWQLQQQNQSPLSFHGHSGAPSTDLWCIAREPQDWAMYGRDPSNSFTGAGPRSLELKWQFTTSGPVISSPTIVDGIVYVGSLDHKIYALDAYTGAKKWEFETDYQVKSSVAVVDGKVFTGVDDGNVYCLDAATGNKLWEKHLTDMITVMSLNLGPNSRSSPKVVGNKYYIGTLDGKLHCLNTANGDVLFSFNGGGAILCSPAVVDGAVYFYANKKGSNATYYKIDANTAAVIWQFNLPYLRTQTSRFTGPLGGDISAAPVYAKGAIYQPWDGGNSNPNAGGLYKINATTGQIMWNSRTYWTSDTVISRAPMVYFEGIPHYESTLPANTTNPDGVLISYANRNLDLTKIKYTKQDVIICNDLFYRVLGLNATNGKRLWEVFVGRETYGTAVAYTGTAYTTCEAKVIFSFDSLTGQKLSFYEPPGQSWSNPALYNGMMYTGSQDWNVRCFGEAQGKTTVYPTVSVSASKTQVNKTQSVDVTGCISPVFEGVPIKVSFIRPDKSMAEVEVKTKADGTYEASYAPNTAGQWGIAAWYGGDPECGVEAAWSNVLSLNVVEPASPSPPPPPPEEPTAAAIPPEVVYAGVGVGIIVIAAAVGYMLMKRRKK